MQSLLVLGLAAAVVLTATLFWNSRTERRRRSVFAGRPDITVDEIHSTFYADSAVSKPQLEQALREISECVGVPVTRLRPSDRFRVELAAERAWEFDDGLGVLTSMAEKKLHEKGAMGQDAVAQIQTVDDYVRLSTA